ncbi:uncharacterized protein LOC105185799 isoform X3 [Harpegnathos saltator]|uniref:uncharacterized protein LOC105185799 isoform X3 n=1 Tax=Harpegnathos saltator TaxID=610380 RepID=UPI000DBED534|nr:uncharacterized protein LOC105185799 isoform X3 [Harpegnathos saltator]
MAEENIILDKHLLEYLQTYVRNINLEAPTFYVTRACKKGDNFVGLVYNVRIEGIENDKIKNINVILKTPVCLSHNLVQSVSLYKREIFFYREILPLFKETLKKHGGIADLFPTFYDAHEEPKKEVLVLENLMLKGFTMKSSRIMDYPHVSLTLRSLGEFHAYSFITRVADPINFNKLKQMKEPLFYHILKYNNDEYINYLCTTVGKALIGEEKHYVERYQKFVDNILHNLNDVVDGNAAEPYTVVNHGDAWTNNILYKYDEPFKNIVRSRGEYGESLFADAKNIGYGPNTSQELKNMRACLRAYVNNHFCRCSTMISSHLIRRLVLGPKVKNNDMFEGL